MPITALYAALCALIVLILGLRVSMYRNAQRIGIGDGGDPRLQRRIRAHANAVEHLPLTLLLLLLLELGQAQPWLLHLLGATLVAARVLHAVGLNASGGKSWPRFSGALATYVIELALALLLLWQYGARFA